MDITMGIISLFLKKQYHITENSLSSRDFPVKGFQIWRGNPPKRELLYIVENEQLNGFIQEGGKLCIGIRYAEDSVKYGCYGISVDEPLELYQLINALQDIFQEFFEWRIRVERLFYTHADFEEILNEIEQTFDLISLLVDKNLQYMAFSDSYVRYNPWVGSEKTIPVEALNDLMDDENFRIAIQHNKAFLYHNAETKMYSYCYNIKIKGKYEARILIQDKTGSIFPGGLALAGYVGKNMTEMFSYFDQERAQERVLYDFYDMIKALLQGIPKNTEEIRQKLSVRGWKKEHLYQVYQFQFMEAENASVTRRYYQSKIEDLLGDCCVLPDDKRLCCIRNLSVTEQRDWDVRQELSVFLRDNLCQTGISQQFTDISFLHRYYLEAQYALELGTRSEDTAWYYPFESMVLPFIWSQAARELSPTQLCHPEIRRLIEYDEKEHAELTATVREYMKHRYNVTETAKALFIHRTTLLFRLQRVEKLTGIDWNSWEERLWLGITLELLKK